MEAISNHCVNRAKSQVDSTQLRNSRGTILLALGVILTIGAFLRIDNLGAECYDCDELYAVRIQGFSVKNLGMVMGRDGLETNHPPLMTVPFLAWNSVVGTSEVRVRSLPLLLGLMTLIVVYRIGVRLHGPLVGCYAALLMAINPLHIAYSREARQYAMLVMLVAAAHLIFIRLLQQGGRLILFGYYICISLAIFTHYFAIPALVAHPVILIWRFLRGDQNCRRSALNLSLPYLLAMIPFAAWLPILRHQASHPWPHLARANTQMLLTCLNDVAGIGVTGTAYWILGIVIFGLLMVLGMSRNTNRSFLFSDEIHQVCSLRPLLGMIVSIVGSCGAPTLFLGFPKMIAPVATDVLQSYGYSGRDILQQLSVLRWSLFLFPLSIALVGLLIRFWPAVVALLLRIPTVANPSISPLSVSSFIGLLLLSPLVVVGLIGLLGVPFLTPRNLLILVLPINLLLALGLEACSSSRLGRVAAVVCLLVMIGSFSSYSSVAKPFGRDGLELGMTTPRWRDLDATLRPHGMGIPLITVHSPSTDPALYYLSDWHIHRIRDVQELVSNGLPTHFRFLGLKQDRWSRQLMARLNELPLTSSVLHDTGEFVVLDMWLVPLQSAR